MRFISAALIAGAVGVFGVCGSSMARPEEAPSAPHFVTVQLPGGGVAQITYFGNVAPRIVVDPSASYAPAPMFVAVPGSGFAVADPFAALDRVEAEMDAQADAMMRQAVMMSAGPEAGYEVGPELAPPGMVSTTYVASFGSGGFCARSVSVHGGAPGMRPLVVSHVSGSCGAGAPRDARLLRARATSPQGVAPYAGLVHPAVMYTPAQ
jgi:hypothetical protein